MKKLYLVLLFIIFVIIFHAWFLLGNISGYDHPYLYPERLRDYSFLPLAWAGSYGNGFGQNLVSLLWVETYLQFIVTIFSNFLHLPWEFVQRIGWFFPYFVLAIFVPYYFLNSIQLVRKNVFVYIASCLIFSLNTYILMIIAGGQMNIALAYIISPLVLLRFIRFSDIVSLSLTKIVRDSLLTSLLFSLEILFDLRLAGLLFFAGLLFCFISIIHYEIQDFNKKNIVFKIRQYSLYFFFVYFITSLVAFFLHFFWILPLLFLHQNPVEVSGAAYSNINAVVYFSFAKLENSISLLHPYWPENIFGKVGFMKPEFLFLPILAFLSLLFLRSGKNKSRTTLMLVYFSLLGLLGAFLSKGTNDPFGEVYTWFFLHIPGFDVFRDSTKFYIYISLSYFVLIAYSLSAISDWINQVWRKKYFSSIFLVVVILYLLFLIRPALLWQLNGTLQSNVIPQEYTQLEAFLNQDKSFSRTLWVPIRQRYGFYDNKHPAVNAQDFFQIYNRQQLLKKLESSNAEPMLQNASIKYVIVPIDVEKEIFMKDRKYANSEYNKTLMILKSIQWLKQINQFKQLAVFEVPDPKDHFWIPNRNTQPKYTLVNPIKYTVSVTNAKKGDRLVFSESYDKNWNTVLDSGSKNRIANIPHDKLFNSFVLPKDGNYTMIVSYEPQKLVEIGLWISLVSLILVLGGLVFLRNKVM